MLLLPFRRVAAWCGEQGVELSSDYQVNPAFLEVLSWSVETAARYGFWDCRCLTQALAAKAMLRRRGLESTIYFGLANPEKKELEAHAWLRCGERLVTGEEGHQKFSEVARFT